MMINWQIKKFDELTPHELYAILRLRSEVFVVEQNCVFQDMDNKDQQCYHLMGWLENKLIAYTRIVPPGLAYDLPSIGRVVISPDHRQAGAGKDLMAKSIKETARMFGSTAICIGAQYHLKKFYEDFGFAQTGDIYDEDGIDHIKMIRR